jgi:hypothetical protein
LWHGKESEEQALRRVVCAARIVGCSATSRKVAGSIPDGVVWIFH